MRASRTTANPVLTHIPSFPPCGRSAICPFKFIVGDGANDASSESITVGGAGGLGTVGAGAGAWCLL